MTLLAVVLSCVALVISIVNLSANIEIFASIKSIRKATDIVDDLAPLDPEVVTGIDAGLLAEHVRPLGFGLEPTAFIFLSTKCESCNAIAFDTDGRRPGNSAFIVTAGSVEEAQAWIDRYKISKFAVHDLRSQLATQCRIDVFPSVVLTSSDHAVVGAYALSSARRLREIVDDQTAPVDQRGSNYDEERVLVRKHRPG